jgi:hypothetical protein
MTANFKLSLPTDIPWTRRCVSPDMLALKPCSGDRPLRWRSSIAVFEYEPAEEDQNFPNTTISYLKITCSITGYQEDPKEIGLNYKGLHNYWKDRPGIDNYVNALQKYYACYGAVLEVVVCSEHAGLAELQPYFLDFEPKKRELYEAATDTRERQSRSAEALNLTKSAGNTQSLEIYDIDMGGGGQSQQGSFAGTGGGYSVQYPNGQWGTKRINADESMSSRSWDVGEEKRNTFSYTTQVSQLYHQLDSYHLGTNRALFFLLPRPHTLETEHTFVNGLRNIEGVQEFFLIVARPKDAGPFCVEAHLETGHIGKVPRTETEQLAGTTRVVFWQGQYAARPRGDDDETTVYDDADRFWNVSDDYPGYQIVNAVLTLGTPNIRDNKGGANLIDDNPHISAQTADFVKVSGKVHSGFANYWPGEDRWQEITYPFTVEITIANFGPVEHSDDTLFITARNLCCCPMRFDTNGGVVYERPMKDRVAAPLPGMGGGMSIASANRFRTEFKNAILDGSNDPRFRYDTPIRLHETDFAARALAIAVRNVENVKLRDLAGLPEAIRRKLAPLRQDLHMGALLSMPFEMQRDLFGLDFEETLQLRRAISGIDHRPEDIRRSWLTEQQIAYLYARADGQPGRGAASGGEDDAAAV